ncbi:hypothetical protein F5Y00DRAFT_225781 [Daldinia vernicosa]|uniref:uncharacterized protein n=1 Tax=Daldinia vernicosa TaxID=114800 RepID=UPI002007E555|nr:uncharacterized protein F5Y00DRAFT_225781 [Daldinia vernicosa]KAI0853221.1 hypothetical protein F5Y00DRAFT_225781 [Daldinia vernicosa]
MDTANLAAAWLSFAVTTVGLGGLISQASAINDQLDPFHANRTAEYLGIWFQRQQRFPWWRITKPPPLGPAIAARMSDGFCGVNVLYVTRIPVAPPGRAGWSTILAMFNHDAPSLYYEDVGAVEKGGAVEQRVSLESGVGRREVTCASVRSASWSNVARKSLKRHQSHACIVISRTTLITMLVVTNGRPVFQYSDASGFRAGYASYCGQWYITWPIGQEAIVKFAAHDSIGATEVLPRSFTLRVDRCGQMVSGVVSSPTSDFAVGFSGRKPSGTYRLEYAPRGFQGAHSGRHLYNMLGGRAFDVDFLYARPTTTTHTAADGEIKLDLPSKDTGDRTVAMIIPPAEQDVLRRALDSLPWTHLSWSMHRGLRDMLLAYGKPTMDRHRTTLASLLRETVAQRPEEFRSRGWDREFVRSSMGPMAAAAVLSGGGNSGDSVRVVTDAAAVYAGSGWGLERLDEVSFWRLRERERSAGFPETLEVEEVEVELDAEAVVALTKFFVLEWSQEFDYQLYHHLPISLYFG